MKVVTGHTTVDTKLYMASPRFSDPLDEWTRRVGSRGWPIIHLVRALGAGHCISTDRTASRTKSVRGGHLFTTENLVVESSASYSLSEYAEPRHKTSRAMLAAGTPRIRHRRQKNRHYGPSTGLAARGTVSMVQMQATSPAQGAVAASATPALHLPQSYTSPMVGPPMAALAGYGRV